MAENEPARRTIKIGFYAAVGGPGGITGTVPQDTVKIDPAGPNGRPAVTIEPADDCDVKVRGGPVDVTYAGDAEPAFHFPRNGCSTSRNPCSTSRNRCSTSSEIDVPLPPKSVFHFLRNTPAGCSATRSCSGWTTRSATGSRSGEGPLGGLRDFSDRGPLARLRSHPPNKRRDGGDPVTTRVTADGIALFGVGVNLKYRF